MRAKVDYVSIDKKGPEGKESWVMPPLAGENDFRKDWLGALSSTENRGLQKFEEFWQSHRVIDELTEKRSVMLAIARNPFNPLIRTLWMETRAYAYNLNEVIEINWSFKRALHLITQAATAMQGCRGNPKINPLISKYADSLGQLAVDMRREVQEYWSKAFQNDALDSAVFHGLTICDYPRQERNLDSRYQIRLAAILRDFDPRLSLLTISRLVVLAYLCAGLVKKPNNVSKAKLRKSVLILGTDRKISVQSIYEKLRQAGLK